MAVLAYIGGEISGAGYRLAGLTVLTPTPTTAAVANALRDAATAGAECILLAHSLARLLPRDSLEAALSRFDPLLAIVPDGDDSGDWPDLALEVRAALGIEA
jgi:vacuolar-type H+-ATPase subunit F/Vma7